MSQGFRVSQFEEIDKLLERVRQAEEADRELAPVEDRVEKHRTAFYPDGPAHRVDVHQAFTRNLEVSRFNPEKIGQSRNGAGRIVVKAEARGTDYNPTRREREPEWLKAERALEQAVDYNEEVLVPNAKNQVTTGAVEGMQKSVSPQQSTDPATEPQAPPSLELEAQPTTTEALEEAPLEPTLTSPGPKSAPSERGGSAFEATAIVRERRR